MLQDRSHTYSNFARNHGSRAFQYWFEGGISGEK